MMFCSMMYFPTYIVINIGKEQNSVHLRLLWKTVDKTLLTDLHIENTGASEGRPESGRETRQAPSPQKLS